MGQVTDRLRRLRDEQGASAPATVVSLVESGVTRYATGTASGNGRGQVDFNLTELFSDRTVDLNDEQMFADLNPFSTRQPDYSTLTIDVNGLKATMVLHSWGDGVFSFSLQDEGGVLTGVDDPSGHFLITVGEIQGPSPIK